MAKPRSKVADYLVYLLVRFFLCVIQALSLRAALRLAEGLAWIAYYVDRRHRLVADDNLRHAFPGVYDDRQRDRLVRAVYRHFCMMLMEIVHLPRKLHATTWRQYMELVGGRYIVGALLSGRPVMIVTGHFGNWELAGYALGLLGFRTYAIARRLDNPYLDDFLLNRFRQRTGQTILDKKDMEGIQSVLAAGGAVATLGDQDAGQRGLFVDFFGRPASTHKAIALLTLNYNALMLVSGTPRVAEPTQYESVAEELIDPSDYANHPDVMRALTEHFTAVLERRIRQHPEQYFWLHRRWKHQPKGKKSRPQAA
jgi:KDO2-lipid IV(A) lauroyltransferase